MTDSVWGCARLVALAVEPAAGDEFVIDVYTHDELAAPEIASLVTRDDVRDLPREGHAQ